MNKEQAKITFMLASVKNLDVLQFKDIVVCPMVILSCQ